MLTAHKVQTDIISLLAGSELAQGVSGEIYRYGYRPRNSQKEDIVVIFIDGMPTQIEQGAVTLNIYVPDITPNNDGVDVEDGKRTSAIEEMAARWVKSLTTKRSSYKFNLLSTISTYYDEDAHQHFVAVRMSYEYKE